MASLAQRLGSHAGISSDSEAMLPANVTSMLAHCIATVVLPKVAPMFHRRSTTRMLMGTTRAWPGKLIHDASILWDVFPVRERSLRHRRLCSVHSGPKDIFSVEQERQQHKCYEHR